MCCQYINTGSSLRSTLQHSCLHYPMLGISPLASCHLLCFLFHLLSPPPSSWSIEHGPVPGYSFSSSNPLEWGRPVCCWQTQSLNVEILSCSLEHEDKSTANTEPEYHRGAELGGSAHYLCLGKPNALASCSLPAAQSLKFLTKAFETDRWTVIESKEPLIGVCKAQGTPPPVIL